MLTIFTPLLAQTESITKYWAIPGRDPNRDQEFRLGLVELDHLVGTHTKIYLGAEVADVSLSAPAVLGVAVMIAVVVIALCLAGLSNRPSRSK